MIHRIDKTNPKDWGNYPLLEARVRAFAQKYDLKCPIEPVLAEMQQRWIAAPQLTGYFISTNQQGWMDGHLVAWIQSYYGQNRFFIYQAEMDSTSLHTLPCAISAFKSWIDETNSKLPADAQVVGGEFVTWHDAEIWQRYLHRAGVHSTKLRTVIQMEL